jgi:hypothetical protein
MKTQTKARSIIPILSLTAIVFSGCFGSRVDLVDNQTVSLVQVPTKHLYISSAAIYQKGNAAEVRGVIRPRHRGFHGPGHVDIAVVAPDGTVLEEARALYHPRILQRKSDPHAHFTATLSAVPPQGSTVRLSYHKDEDPSSLPKPFHCERHAACPAVEDKEE